MDYLTWSIDPVMFQLDSFVLRWYGLFFATGFILGYYIMRWIYIRENKNPRQLDKLLWYIIAGTLIGARLLHCLFYEPNYYLHNPLEIFKIWRGGLASHGATLGIMLSIYWYQRHTSESWLWILDRLSIPIALAAFFIRIGNFFNSEIIGTASNKAWAIIFIRVDSIPRHPSQLYEALCYLGIFILLLSLYLKFKLHTKKASLFAILLLLVFSCRFLIEFSKEPLQNYNFQSYLSIGQILSIPLILIAIMLLFNRLKSK